MTPREYVDELLYPARSSQSLIALITFVLLLSLVRAAGIIGIWLAVIVVPALLRYMTLMASARARGLDAEPPEITDFSLIGNVWTLFPIVIFVFAGYVVYFLATEQSQTVAILATMLFAIVVPAMIVVLVITHSPVEALNPIAIVTLIREIGPSYLYLPVTALLVALVPILLSNAPRILQTAVELYLLFAFFAVAGASTHRNQLMDEVYIDTEEASPEKQLANLERERMSVLNHAYGLISRGNRDGGFAHVEGWLAEDPDPYAAWPWFFEQMLAWEQPMHALFFAQRYISRLLADGEQVQAVKVILRARMLDERFKPAADDLDTAVEAAEACGNPELGSVLRRL